MNEKIEVFDKKKLNSRPCGQCGEDDTMLFCCECMRKIREGDKDKRNAEVKKEIEELKHIYEIGLACRMPKSHRKIFKKIVDNLNEILQKLGLDAKEDKTEMGDKK